MLGTSLYRSAASCVAIVVAGTVASGCGGESIEHRGNASVDGTSGRTTNSDATTGGSGGAVASTGGASTGGASTGGASTGGSVGTTGGTGGDVSAGGAPRGGAGNAGSSAVGGTTGDRDGCGQVSCLPTDNCPVGTHVGRPAGACCPACIADMPPACGKPGCGDAGNCPLGYTLGSGPNGCCSECVPDPSYCEADSDCALAVDIEQCCGTVGAVSTRLLDDDHCYLAHGDMGYPPAGCVVPLCLCDIAPPTPTAECLNHTCTTVPFGGLSPK